MPREGDPGRGERPSGLGQALEEASQLLRREEGERLATRQWPSVSSVPGDQRGEARAAIALYLALMDRPQTQGLPPVARWRGERRKTGWTWPGRRGMRARWSAV